MSRTSKVTTLIASAVFTTAIPALADGTHSVAFAAEVDSCIAAVTRNLDLDQASRVRHVVTEQNHSGSARALTIETSVFSGTTVKSYEAYCVARGDKEPLQFHMDEIRG